MTWAEYIAWLVAEHGSLAKVAKQAAEARRDVVPFERALRRLGTGKNDGGKWGRRLVQVFGLPQAIADRVRWMGVHHSRFNELPVDACVEQLRAWDQPPLSEAPQRVWLCLGLAGCALRRGQLVDAERHLLEASEVTNAPVDARVELGLLEALLAASLDGEPDLLSLAPLVQQANDPCLTARWLDQGAVGRALPEARALYERISTGLPFTAAKRNAGLAYVAWQEGRLDEARAHANEAIRAAGDGGFTRLRLTYLGLLAHIAGGEEAQALRQRAIEAARALGDEELAARLDPASAGAAAEAPRLPPPGAAARRRTASRRPRTSSVRRRP